MDTHRSIGTDTRKERMRTDAEEHGYASEVQIRARAELTNQRRHSPLVPAQLLPAAPRPAGPCSRKMRCQLPASHRGRGGLLPGVILRAHRWILPDWSPVARSIPSSLKA
eukprot:3083194-Rhodomonas_salina.1